MKLPAKVTVLMLSVLLAVVAGCGDSDEPAIEQAIESQAPTGDYLGQTPPGGTPQLFAPGIISTGLYERDLAMTPDAAEIYFGLISGSTITIAMVKREEGAWSRPEILSCFGDPDIFDLEPHITPDGKRFLFLSTRPLEGQEKRSGWAYQDIWAMDRTGDGWGPPYNLGPPVCSEAPEYFPSVTRDGDIYFTREIEENGRQRSVICRSRLVDGAYAETEVLPEQVNPGDRQFNAFIDPDERFLIVPIAGLPDNIGRADYYVAFHNPDDSWTGPVNMGGLINTTGNNVTSPYISPDGKYFFFASNRTDRSGEENPVLNYGTILEMASKPQNGSADIYWIDASFIESLRPQPAELPE